MWLLTLVSTICRLVMRLVMRFVTGRRFPQSSATELFARMTVAAEESDMDAYCAAAAALIEDSVRMVHETVMATSPRPRRQQLQRMGSEELADALYAAVEPTIGDDANEEVVNMFKDACRRHAEKVA